MKLLNYKNPKKQFMLKPNSLLSLRQHTAIVMMIIILSSIIVYSIWIMSKNKTKTLNTAPPRIERGTIYDRRGHILATQIEEYTVSLWLPAIRGVVNKDSSQETKDQIKRISTLLAPIILWPQKELYEKILTHSSNTLTLLRRADIQMKNRLELLMNEYPFVGLRIEAEFSRSYPQGDMAAPLLGYLNLDSHGGGGLEYAFDRFLSPINIINNQNIVQGYSLELTLDINLQASVESILKQGLQEEEATAAVALVMDAHNGEILSYVSLPSFNPTFYHRYQENERTNRPVVEAYEPGSVFKIFTMAAMLEANVMDPNETFCCPGHYEQTLNGETFRIKCTSIHGEQSIADILANSCNAGMAYFSERISNSEFHKAITAFGFGKRTQIPLSGETIGILSDPKDWSARTKPTIAMGQEIGVSSIQIMQAASALANNGTMIKPRIVKHLIDSSGNIYQSYQREEAGKAVSSRTSSILLTQMQHSVEHGIARRLQVKDLPVGGKTGTSQTIDPTSGTYSSDKYIASTLTFVPAQNPKYIIYVVMHHPKRSIWGSNVAAPLAKRIIDILVPHVGLPTTQTQNLSVIKTPKILSPIYPIFSDVLPSFEGKSLRQALHFFYQDTLRFRVDGSGFWVTEQFPPANTLIRPNMTIRVKSENDVS